MKTKTREWYGEPYNAWYDGEVKQLHRAGKVVIKYPGYPGQETLLEPHDRFAILARAGPSSRPGTWASCHCFCHSHAGRLRRSCAAPTSHLASRPIAGYTQGDFWRSESRSWHSARATECHRQAPDVWGSDAVYPGARTERFLGN